MDMPDREENEKELAVALLALWFLFSDGFSLRNAANAWETFKAAFDRLIAPILIRIYGTARNTLAGEFGVNYATRQNAAGETVTAIPGIVRRVTEFARRIFDSFIKRFQKAEEKNRNKKEGEPEAEPEFKESDAERTAITTGSDAQSKGELDGKSDIERETGKRLYGIWRTENDARVCPLCSPLDGTVEKWMREWPQGPARHARCRCWLEWRLIDFGEDLPR